MTGKILLIGHNPPPMSDRAHDWVLANGFEADARYPFRGDALPETVEGYAGVIVHGGRFDSDAVERFPFLRDEYDWIDRSLSASLPLLGLCLGAQMIARHLGAGAGPMPDGRIEFGFYEVRPVPGAETFLPGPMTVTQSHYHGFDVPEGAERLAESDLFPNQAFRYGPSVLGLQFHPEARPETFRRCQEAYPGHYERPGCQSRAEQDALIDTVQDAQARWFGDVLAGLFTNRTTA
jgi:GMP synthase (glutamine-hydrolysing)